MNYSLALAPGKGTPTYVNYFIYYIIFLTPSFYCADFERGRPNLSAEEVEILNLLLAIGLDSEDFKLMDELLREH